MTLSDSQGFVQHIIITLNCPISYYFSIFKGEERCALFSKELVKKIYFLPFRQKKIYVGDFDWFTPLTEKPIIEALNIQKKFDEKGRNMI